MGGEGRRGELGGWGSIKGRTTASAASFVVIDWSRNQQEMSEIKTTVNRGGGEKGGGERVGR